jgi:hypothetical protein
MGGQHHGLVRPFRAPIDGPQFHGCDGWRQLMAKEADSVGGDGGTNGMSHRVEEWVTAIDRAGGPQHRS